MPKHKLLIPEPPLQILPSLASAIGLNEAIVLQQVQYWTAQSSNIRDGHRWVYNTYEDWAKQFPFWGERTVRRTIKSLEEKNLLIVGNYNRMAIDRTKWYRINYDLLEHGLGQVGRYDEDEVDSPSGQIGHMDMAGVDAPLPETTQEITTETTHRSQRFNEEDIRLTDLLHELVVQNFPFVKDRLPRDKDYAEMNRIARIDGRPYSLIEAVIRWSQQDSFWRDNIRSVSKMREKFDTLLIKAKAEHDQKAKTRGVVV